MLLHKKCDAQKFEDICTQSYVPNDNETMLLTKTLIAIKRKAKLPKVKNLMQWFNGSTYVLHKMSKNQTRSSLF